MKTFWNWIKALVKIPFSLILIYKELREIRITIQYINNKKL